MALSFLVRALTITSKPALKTKLLELGNYGVTSPRLFLQANLRTQGANKSIVLPAHQQNVDDETKEQNEYSYDTFNKVNHQIENNSHGRLFAVVHLCGKQFKVTTEDIIITEGYWPPTTGDNLKLEKVLLVGSSDFTLVGRPILPLDLITVSATVIEKTLSHTKTKFYKRKRKQFMRTYFMQIPLTYIRITGITFHGKVNEWKETDGLQDKVFEF